MRYRGGDPDSGKSRKAAANYVGLGMPEQPVLGRDAASAAARYAGALGDATRR